MKPRAQSYINMTDELLDLVDDNDSVIGTKKRTEVDEENLTNYRVVNVFIKNSEGELWIPRRTAHKRIFPLCLDMSMGGYVQSGESYEDGLKREMREELNIDTDKVDYRDLGHLSPQKSGVSSYMKVYELAMNEVPKYNKDDFIEYFWLTPQAAIDRIVSGEKAKSDLPKLIKAFYGSELKQ